MDGAGRLLGFEMGQVRPRCVQTLEIVRNFSKMTSNQGMEARLQNFVNFKENCLKNILKEGSSTGVP